VNVRNRLGRAAGPEVSGARHAAAPAPPQAIAATPADDGSEPAGRWSRPGLRDRISERIRAALRDDEWDEPTEEPATIDVTGRLAGWSTPPATAPRTPK
jgi:hypothetical protein